MENSRLDMLREYAHHLSAVAGMDARLFSISSCEFLSEPRFCAGACPLLGQSCSLKNTHLYGSYESERWGNRYIYYCPLGMIFISCTIKDPQTYAEYALIVGPMIMGELSDFYALTGHKSISLEGVPAVSTAQVNSVCQISSLICCGLAENPQGKTAGHFQNEKVDQVFHSLYDDKKPYPIDVEKKLVKYISMGDKANAQDMLNTLLGYIYFYSNGDFKIIKTRLLELMVVLSRATIEGGAAPDKVFWLSDHYLREAEELHAMHELSGWITNAMHRFITYVFELESVKHRDVIYKVLDYVHKNYHSKLSLEDIAQHVYLSKPYLSKLFKEEMKCNLVSYINAVRIGKSKEYLLDENIGIIDIAQLVGFEDQAYFSKVFKQSCGVSPRVFRQSRGRENA